MLTVSGRPSFTTSAASALLRAEGAVIAGDVVGGLLLAVLNRNLHVIETGIGEHAQGFRRQADRRRNEIAVEPGVARGLHDLLQIAPRRRLAARQMDLQHAQPRRLAEHARPGRGVEFAGAVVELQRIGAIRTAERTAMRQLGEQTERRGRWAAAPARLELQQFLVGQPADQFHHVGMDAVARRAGKGLARSSTIASTLTRPVQRLRMSTAMASALNTRSGASRTQPPCASLFTSRTPRGRRGCEVGRTWAT